MKYTFVEIYTFYHLLVIKHNKIVSLQVVFFFNKILSYLQIEFGNQIYLSLLLAEDQSISFGAKAAIMRVLRPRVKKRRVYIPSPPTTPGTGSVTAWSQCKF